MGEKEKKEKIERENNLRKERELKRKREEEEKERVDYASKKKRLEEKEVDLKKAIKFHETRLLGYEQDMDKTKDPVARNAAFTGHKLLREQIRQKQKVLDQVKDDKFKLAESRRNKTK